MFFYKELNVSLTFFTECWYSFPYYELLNMVGLPNIFSLQKRNIPLPSAMQMSTENAQ